MFPRILLPLDLTDKHRTAIDTAAELARRDNGEITLLHVIETIPGLDGAEEKSFYDRLERKAAAHLNQLAAPLTSAKLRWHARTTLGHRASEIARFAGENHADLIVVTAPRFDPANPGESWGSLSYKVSLLSPCPVLLVR